MSGGAGETSDKSVELMLLVYSESLGKVSTLLDLPGEECRVSHVKSPPALGPRKQPCQRRSGQPTTTEKWGSKILKQGLTLVIHGYAKHVIVYRFSNIN